MRRIGSSWIAARGRLLLLDHRRAEARRWGGAHVHIGEAFAGRIGPGRAPSSEPHHRVCVDLCGRDDAVQVRRPLPALTTTRRPDEARGVRRRLEASRGLAVHADE